MNLPGYPEKENYFILKIISNALKIFGWVMVVLSILFTVVYSALAIYMAGSIVEQILPHATTNTTMVLSIAIVVPSILNMFMNFLFTGIMSLATGELIQLLVDMRDDQHYSNRLLYQLTSRFYERTK